MTQLTSDEYVAKQGVHCPNCNGRQITGGFVNIDGGTASQPVTCDECEASWTDVYTLTGYEDLET